MARAPRRRETARWEDASCVASEAAGPSRHAVAPTRPPCSAASSREPTAGFPCSVTRYRFTLDPPAPQPQREEQELRAAGTLNVCFLFPEEPPGSLQPARDGVSLAAITGSRAGGGDGGPSFRPSKPLSFESSFARLSPRVPLGTCRGPRENRPLPATRSSPCPGSCDPLARGPRPRHL